MKLAFEVRNEILDKQGDLSILTTKSSNYNARIIVDKCEICGSRGKDVGHLHVHHIKFQCHADVDGNFERFHKNVDHNLVVLCESCHHNVHKSEINIVGFEMTSEGRRLKWNKRENSEAVDIIIDANDEIVEDALITDNDKSTVVNISDEDIREFIQSTLKAIGLKRGYKKLIIDRLHQDKGVKVDYKRLAKML